MEPKGGVEVKTFRVLESVKLLPATHPCQTLSYSPNLAGVKKQILNYLLLCCLIRTGCLLKVNIFMTLSKMFYLIVDKKCNCANLSQNAFILKLDLACAQSDVINCTE